MRESWTVCWWKVGSERRIGSPTARRLGKQGSGYCDYVFPEADSYSTLFVSRIILRVAVSSIPTTKFGTTLEVTLAPRVHPTELFAAPLRQKTNSRRNTNSRRKALEDATSEQRSPLLLNARMPVWPSVASLL